MFIPIHTHPLFDPDEKKRLQDRWENEQVSPGSLTCQQKIENWISQGANRYLLYRGDELPILEGEWDFRGIRISDISTEYPPGVDHFKGKSFQYAELWRCHFKKAVFFSSSFSFARLYDCTFEDCTFSFAGFFAARLEKSHFIRCDFFEECEIDNIMMLDGSISQCHFSTSTHIRDCHFDDLTKVGELNLDSYLNATPPYRTPNAMLSSLYRSFQLAYEASGAEELAFEFNWKGRCAFTRHNLKSWRRVFNIVNELLTGYGLRPIRPFLSMIILYVAAVACFATKVPAEDGVFIAGGALFTFGAGIEQVSRLGLIWRVLYISLSFLGISLTSLLVTTLANRLFRSRIPVQTLRDKW